MKKILSAALSAFLTGPGYSQSFTPKQLYPGLFKTAQLQKVLGDKRRAALSIKSL